MARLRSRVSRHTTYNHVRGGGQGGGEGTVEEGGGKVVLRKGQRGRMKRMGKAGAGSSPGVRLGKGGMARRRRLGKERGGRCALAVHNECLESRKDVHFHHSS